MFKIISAEIKKIVSKPGIYILSALLALILVLGVFIYKPTVYPSSQFELFGDTYLEKYDAFIPSANAGKKAQAQTDLNNIILAVKNYRLSGLTQKEHIDNLVLQINENLTNYQNCASNNSYQAYIDTVRKKLVDSIKNLNSAIETALINSQNGSFTLLVTSKNYNAYKKVYKEVVAWSEITVEKSGLSDHIALFNDKYSEDYFSVISTFKYPSISDEFIKNYTSNTAGTKYYTLNQRLDNISDEIESNKELATTNANNENDLLAKEMELLANQYVNTVNTYVNLVKYELISNAFLSVSTAEQLNTIHLSDYSEYNSNSLLARYTYLFDKDKSENDFSHPLTMGVASNDSINGYDYAYFVLKIFSFVIIVYAIMSACHSIAGEIKDGTMRYLAIRPVSRTKMLLGKWFAILIMSAILILFSAIIAVCVGWGVYGISSKTILTIFNGAYPITLHPLVMIGIYLISMFLELVVYSSLAILLSTIFKSDLLGMTIMLMLYLLNILVPMFVQGANSWLAFYPFSHISLYSLFGSSIYSVQGNFFNLIFGAKVYAGTHIALTLGLITIIVLLTSALAVKIFDKKEL